MSEPFIGEIKMFAGNFAPRGWALCDGQTLPISSNSALFSLLGTTYGGDGRTNFRLPDLRGRVAVHEGTGPGLPNRPLGQGFGAVSANGSTTLNASNLPEIKYPCNSGEATEDSPEGNYPAFATEDVLAYHSASNAEMAAAGNAAPVPINMSVDVSQPSLVVNYIIALIGIFPSRS